MYRIEFFANTQRFDKEFSSIGAVRSWANYQNYVVGTPAPRVCTFLIEHLDGSGLSRDELNALDCGAEKYKERQADVLNGFPGQAKQNPVGLYDGAVNAIVFGFVPRR